MKKIKIVALLVTVISLMCLLSCPDEPGAKVEYWTVSFDINGGTSKKISSIQVVKGQSMSGQYPLTPTKTGYILDGWYDESVEPIKKYDSATAINKNLDLKAHWIGDTYTVTFNKNGGDTDANPAAMPVTMPATTVDTLPEAPTRIGYDFVDWYDTAAAAGGTEFKADTTVNADITVYARWNLSGNQTEYWTVSFDIDDGTPSTIASIQVAKGQSAGGQYPANPTKTGYIFGGWYLASDSGFTGTQYDAATAITADTSLKAKWTVIYTVTFDKNNTDSGSTEANPAAKTVTYPATTIGTLPEAPTRTGYTFAGWYDTVVAPGGTQFTAAAAVTANVTVYARWTVNYWTVSFNTDGGTPSTIANIQVIKGQSIGAQFPANPAKTGYTFGGWYLASDSGFTGAQYTSSATITADTALKAKWTANFWIVSFNTDGGTPSTIANIQVIKGQSIGSQFPANPAKTGYTFSGWYLASDYGFTGTKYDAATAITVDTSLKAKWTGNVYVVTFNKNGGETEANPASKTVTVPATTVGTLPTAPTLTDYGFVGWYDTANASGGTQFTATTAVNANITVYARWTMNYWTISFDTNGGIPSSIANIQVVKGQSMGGQYPANPAKTGYTFGGWYDTAATSGGTQFTATTAVTANVTVYARWTANSYVVTFNKNNTDSGSTEASPAGITVTYPATTVGTLPTAPTRTGYTFVGWFDTTATSGGNQFLATTAVNANVTVYARWTANSYVVTFNKNNTDSGSTEASPAGITVTYPATTVGALPTEPTRTGYTFAGWFDTTATSGGTQFLATTAVTASITVYARWTANSYVVTFDKNGGETEANPASKTVTYPATTVGTLPTEPIRTGYTFAGWYDTTATSGGTQFIATTAVTANVTVHARWTANSYVVTFDKNGGETEANPASKTVTVPATTVGTLPTAPTRTGYTFAGWYDTVIAPGGTQFTATTTVTASITVYARWTMNYWTISFDTNGGIPSSIANIQVVKGQSMGGQYPANPTKTDYTFGGWYLASDSGFTGAQYTSVTAITADTALKAKWTANYWNVTFNTDEGTPSSIAGIQVVKGQSMGGQYPANPTKTGYTFSGWYLASDYGYTGTQYDAATAITAETSLKARWTANSYVVTFNKNNTDSGSTEANPAGITVTVPATTVGTLPTAPTRTGYTFAGWYNTADTSGGNQFLATTAVNANVTVYARWTANSYIVTFNKNNTDSGSTEASPAGITVTYPATTVGALPTEPTRTGYTFAGWFDTTATSGGTQFLATTAVTANVTVYARWTANSYVVTFNKNNTDSGSTEANPASKTVTYPATTVGALPTEPTRTGYTFAGWFDTTATSGGTQFLATTAVNANVTVYARWTANSYVVTFNKNNTDTGSTEASPAGITVTYPATTVGTLPTAPTRTGYIFAGWYDTVVAPGGTQFTATTAVTASVTVYARWTMNYWTISFDTNGGTPSSIANIQVVKGQSMGGQYPANPTKTDYTFGGWYLASDDDFIGTPYTSSTTITADTALKAKWTANYWNVTFNTDEGTPSSIAGIQVAKGQSMGGQYPANPTKTGYTFSGWYLASDYGYTGTQYDAATAITAETSLKARWTANSYVVTFDKNNTDSGSTEASPAGITVTYPATTVGTLPTAPTRTGYTFAGWYNTADTSGGNQFLATTAVTANVTVHARWTANSYVVTFNKNNTDSGSTEASPAGITVTYPATTVGTLPTAPTRTGYTFAGWFDTTATSGGTQFLATTAVTASITVYARWTANSYVVTFNKNNTDSGSTEASPAGITVTYPATTVGALPTAPTRTGYTFAGWFDTTATSGGNQFLATTAVNVNVTVYARWTANSYVVTFDKNGGETEANPASKTVTVPATTVGALPTAPTRTGYIFAGWYDTAVANGGTQFTATTTVTANVTVYARWTANSYIVTFNKNNTDSGSTEASPAGITVTYPATTVGALPTAPTRTGYTFAGWFDTTATSGGNQFLATTAVNANVTVYARWTANSYVVTFDKNGGETEANPASKTVTVPATTVGTLPTEPTRTGYIFAGWYDTVIAPGGTQFTATTTVTASITVYARWTMNYWTISFDTNGGIPSSIAGIQVVKGQSMGSQYPANPTKTDYTFGGWYLASDSGFTGAQYTSVTAITADTALKAKWTANFWNVTFNTDEGTPSSIAGIQVVKGQSMGGQYPANPAKTGYTFSGWYLASDYGYTGTKYDAATAITAETSLKARWTANSYVVTFNKNNTDSGSTEASPAGITVTYPATTVGTLPTAPTRTGYTFAGWFDTTATSGGTQFLATTAVNANVTVYARWTANSYVVTFDKNGGETEANPVSKTVTYPATTVGTLPTEPTRTGYTFAGWYNTNATSGGTQFLATTAVTANVTVYARWTANSYVVTFNKNNTDSGSTEASPAGITVTYPATTVGTLPTAPTRTGYTFAGWFDTTIATGGTQFTATTAVTANVTVYARWTANSYVVTFNKNNTDSGSTEASPAGITVTYPATTVGTLPTVPTRTGYTFAGWFDTTATSGGTQFLATTAVTASITVYARWTANSYVVTFNKNNTDSGSAEASPAGKTVTYPATTVGTLPTAPTRTGYTFAGWYDTADTSGGTQFLATTAVNVNVTVYARWTANSYVVTFDKNGGETEANPASKTVTVPATTVGTLPTAPTRTGYIFAGWYDTAVANGGTQFTATTTVTASVTVYARWTMNYWIVSFDTNGGTPSSIANIQVVKGQSMGGQYPANPTKTDYTFGGWYLASDDDFIGTPYTSSTTITADTALKAKWTANYWNVTFNTDEGTPSSIAGIQVAKGQSMGGQYPANPTKTGYTFSGWYLASDYGYTGTQYDAATAITAETSLKARWNSNNANIRAVTGSGTPQAKYGLYIAGMPGLSNGTPRSSTNGFTETTVNLFGNYTTADPAKNRSIVVITEDANVKTVRVGINNAANDTAPDTWITLSKNDENASSDIVGKRWTGSQVTAIPSASVSRRVYVEITAQDGTIQYYRYIQYITITVTDNTARGELTTLTIGGVSVVTTGQPTAPSTSGTYAGWWNKTVAPEFEPGSVTLTTAQAATGTVAAEFYNAGNNTGNTVSFATTKTWPLKEDSILTFTPAASGTTTTGNITFGNITDGDYIIARLNAGTVANYVGLYSHYIIKVTIAPTYNVTFDTNSGTPSTIPGIQVIQGQSMGSQFPTAPTRAGYTFGGWYLASDYNFIGTQYTSSTNITADTALRARWNISLSTNANIRAVTGMATSGDTPANATFGLYIGGVPAISNGTPGTSATQVTGTTNGAPTENGTISGNTETQSPDRSIVVIVEDANVSKVEYGYVSSDSDTTAPTFRDMTRSIDTSSIPSGLTGKVWTSTVTETYTTSVRRAYVRITAEDGNTVKVYRYTLKSGSNNRGVISTATTGDPVMTIGGVTVDAANRGTVAGWWNKTAAPDFAFGSVTIPAGSTVTVTSRFDNNGVTGMTSYARILAADWPLKEGYTPVFSYSNTGAHQATITGTVNNVQNGDYILIRYDSQTANATYIGYFGHYIIKVTIAPTYNVTFDTNSGTPSTIAGIQVIQGQSMGSQFPTAPTRAGYTFGGWYLASDYNFIGTQYTSSTNITADTALKAKWNENFWTVSFITDGGTPSTIAGIQVEKGQSMGTQFPTAPTKAGYTFGGWYLASDYSFNGTQYISNTPITADTDLKARWNAGLSTNANIRAVTGTGANALYGLYIGGMPAVSNGTPGTSAATITGTNAPAPTANGKIVSNTSTNTVGTPIVVIVEDANVSKVEFGTSADDSTAPGTWVVLGRNETNNIPALTGKRWTGTLTAAGATSSAWVRITAQNGTSTQVYRYTWYVASSARATLSSLSIGGTTVTSANYGSFAGWWNLTTAPNFTAIGSVSLTAAGTKSVVSSFTNQSSTGITYYYKIPANTPMPLLESAVLPAASFTSSAGTGGTGDVADLANGDYILIRYVSDQTSGNYWGLMGHYLIKVTCPVPDPYRVTVTPDAPYTFSGLTAGYTERTSRTVTLSNSGTQPTGNLTVSITGTNSGSFEFDSVTNTVIGNLAAGGLAVGGSANLTVRPKLGLTVGSYSAAVSITGGNGISASFAISVTVRDPSSPSYIGITSDVHWDRSTSSTKSGQSQIFESWMTKLGTKHYTNLDYMLFCGDLGSPYRNNSNSNPDPFWADVGELFGIADNFVTSGFVRNSNIFITGNHEWQTAAGGQLLSHVAALKTRGIYDRLNVEHSEVVKTNDFIIYTFGPKPATTPPSSFQEFPTTSIATLSAYLATAPKDIPIFILSHFPIHAMSTATRWTANASALIDVLNNYPNVIFLWGHNHSNRDPMYRSIKGPGYTMTTTANSATPVITKPINFLYVPAGAMRDAEYQDGIAQDILTKGIVVKIDGKELTFTYYDKNCDVINNAEWQATAVYTLTGNGYVEQ